MSGSGSMTHERVQSPPPCNGDGLEDAGLDDRSHNLVWEISERATCWALRRGLDPLEVAIKWVTAEGFDALDELVWEPLYDGVHNALDVEEQRSDPDSEYNKYATPHVRRVRIELARGFRRWPARSQRRVRRLDRRLAGGTPRARRASTRSSSRGGDSGDSDPGEPPPPDVARLAPGVLACPIGGRA